MCIWVVSIWLSVFPKDATKGAAGAKVLARSDAARKVQSLDLGNQLFLDCFLVFIQFVFLVFLYFMFSVIVLFVHSLVYCYFIHLLNKNLGPWQGTSRARTLILVIITIGIIYYYYYYTILLLLLYYYYYYITTTTVLLSYYYYITTTILLSSAQLLWKLSGESWRFAETVIFHCNMANKYCGWRFAERHGGPWQEFIQPADCTPGLHKKISA